MCAKKKATSKNKKTLFSHDYYSDLQLPDMLTAKIVRSPFDSGVISDISIKNLSEGSYLITAKDITGQNSVVTLGQSCPLFLDKEIAYKGQPIALLVSENEDKIKDLEKKIKIKYKNDKLQKIINDLKKSSIAYTDKTEKRIKTDEKQVSNVDEQEFLAAFKNSDLVIEGSWSPNYVEDYKGEKQGSICFVKNNNLYVFTPCRWISHLRENISRTTGFSEDKIIINRTNLGKYNSHDLWMNTILTCQTCIAAIKTEKPVKLILTRQEQTDFICNYAKVSINHKTAVNKNGKITAMDIGITVDTGAFNPLACEYLDRLIIASTGIYTPPVMRIHAANYRTKSMPLTINMALSDCYAQFAIENQIHKIAQELNISVFDIKNLNCSYLSEKAKKIKIPFIHNFKSEQIINAFDTICSKNDFYRKEAVYRISKSNDSVIPYNLNYSPPIRGIGLSSCFEGSTFFGSIFMTKNLSLELTLHENSKLTVHFPPPSSAIKDIWINTIKEILGIEKKDITIEKQDLYTEQNIPESLNSNISLMTHLLRKCCEALKRKRNKEELPVTVKKGITYTQKKLWDKKSFTGTPFYATSFGNCIVEIELDPCTYREKVLSINYVIEAGQIINIEAAKNTILNETYHCLKQLIEDEIVVCKNINVDFIPSKDEPKQLGHIVYSLLPVAFIQALSQASNKTITKLPIKTDTLFEMIMNNQGE